MADTYNQPQEPPMPNDQPMTVNGRSVKIVEITAENWHRLGWVIQVDGVGYLCCDGIIRDKSTGVWITREAAEQFIEQHRDPANAANADKPDSPRIVGYGRHPTTNKLLHFDVEGFGEKVTVVRTGDEWKAGTYRTIGEIAAQPATAQTEPRELPDVEAQLDLADRQLRATTDDLMAEVEQLRSKLTAAEDENKRLAGERDADRENLAELRRVFGHTHAAGTEHIDRCRKCGLNLRDKIHTRLTAQGQEVRADKPLQMPACDVLDDLRDNHEIG